MSAVARRVLAFTVLVAACSACSTSAPEGAAPGDAPANDAPGAAAPGIVPGPPSPAGAPAVPAAAAGDLRAVVAGVSADGVVALDDGAHGSALASVGVGSACTTSADCSGANPVCFRDDAWVDGYCVNAGCVTGSCPTGSACFRFSDAKNRCLRSCAGAGDCRTGYTCSGAAGSRACVPAPAPAAASCASLPARDCTGGTAYCSQILPFSPVTGLGYSNDPVNGESWSNQWRSWARRDLQQLVRHAAAFVECKAKSWAGGNGQPLGLGDMSEANGATPGTSIGQPGHPQGTHVNGTDMDIAYYQSAASSTNELNAVCSHVLGGVDQYHCVADPTRLDVWRTSLFIGALFTSPSVRVVGVDGRIGPLVQSALTRLCQDGWLPQVACDRARGLLGFEPTNTGRGWFQFHHHHLHVSLTP